MHKQKIDMWKKQLKNMLKSAVLPKQFSGKYPTKTGKLAMPFNTGQYLLVGKRGPAGLCWFRVGVRPSSAFHTRLAFLSGCQIRVASSDAVLGWNPHVNVSLVPECGWPRKAHGAVVSISLPEWCTQLCVCRPLPEFDNFPT